MNNNTIIKYGLYISKKATTFLEDIANGKEINNLSGYFAQFDQYITELKILVGQPSTSETIPTEQTPPQAVSPTPQTNDVQNVTTDTTPTQNT